MFVGHLLPTALDTFDLNESRLCYVGTDARLETFQSLLLFMQILHLLLTNTSQSLSREPEMYWAGLQGGKGFWSGGALLPCLEISSIKCTSGCCFWVQTPPPLARSCCVSKGLMMQCRGTPKPHANELALFRASYPNTQFVQ